MSSLTKLKLAVLRKMAEDKEVVGFEEMIRDELIEALKPPKEEVKPELPEEPKEEEEEEAEAGDESPKVSKVETDGLTAGHAPVGSKAERMRERLAKQPKVSILIPLEGKENTKSTFPVTLNGYRLNIQKGTYVMVPKQVAEVIMNSQKQTVAALREGFNLANPNHPKRRSGEGLSDLNV